MSSVERRPLGDVLLTWPVLVSLALLAGLSYAYVLVGWRVLNPLNLTWLIEDPAMNHVGWEFLRRSNEGWLTHVSNHAYPFGVSIAYLDSIPIVAILLRPFADMLPDDFQYLGPFFALNVVLQAYFAIRLFKNIFPDDPVAVLIGAAFILTAPVLAMRAFLHIALTAQWLIIAALSYYTDDPQRKGVVRYVRTWYVLAAIAASINPYMTLMTLLVAAAGLLRLVLRDLLRPWTAIALAGALGFVAASVMALFGFFSLRSGYDGGGYGWFSLNILGPINPFQYPSLLLPSIPVLRGQHEGYNYLGLGVIAMLVTGLLARTHSLRDLRSPDIWPLVLLGIICTLLAISTRISIGPWSLWSFTLGPYVSTVLGAFRASGRLYWPTYYLLIVAGFVLVYPAIPARIRNIVLVGFLALQLADTQSLRDYVRSYWATANATTLSSAVWQSLHRNHRHLVVVPPYLCDTFGSKGLERYALLPTLAARTGMTMNSVYAGRYTPEHIKHSCTTRERIMAEGMQPDTAYVFTMDAFGNLIERGFVPSPICRPVDELQLCTRPEAG